MLSLVIRKGEFRGRTFRLGERNLTVGRDGRNLVQIVDPEVSRRHAAIVYMDGDYVLSDLRSHNGTRVNGVAHERGAIGIGDRIEIGGTLLEVVPDRGGGRDATRGERVADTAVDRATTASGRSAISADGAWVDVPRLGDQRQLAAIRLAARLRTTIERGRALDEAFTAAASAVEEALGPDRLMLYHVDAQAEPRVAEIHRRPGLSEEQRQQAPHVRTLRRACVRGKPVIENSLGIGSTQVVGLAAAIAVPILAEGSVVGVLYADSFQGDHQLFVAEDQEVLAVIGDAFVGALLR